MEIIKKGKNLEDIKYKFTCSECECEFIATKIEIVGDTYNCPNCGTSCYGEIIEG